MDIIPRCLSTARTTLDRNQERNPIGLPELAHPGKWRDVVETWMEERIPGCGLVSRSRNAPSEFFRGRRLKERKHEDDGGKAVRTKR